MCAFLHRLEPDAWPVDLLLRRDYGLHPHDAMELPDVVWIRYVAAIQVQLNANKNMARQAGGRTVGAVRAPKDPDALRSRLSKFRGWRGRSSGGDPT